MLKKYNLWSKNGDFGAKIDLFLSTYIFIPILFLKTALLQRQILTIRVVLRDLSTADLKNKEKVVQQG